MVPKTGEGGGGRMSVVVPTHRDHGDGRRERVQPRVACAPSTPVVTDLQEVHLPEPPGHGGLGGKSRVSREQHLEIAVLDEEDEGILVDVLAPSGPARYRVEHGESDPIE